MHVTREKLKPALAALSAGQRAGNLCKLCQLSDWQDPEFSRLCGEIFAGNPQAGIKHRKLWEFAKTVQALRTLGLWHEQSRALSVAAGNERLLFFAANQLERVVATDIYGHGNFLEADARFVSRPEAFAPYPFRRDRLKVLSMDALDLRFPAAFFDCAFSLSSIEHFGGQRPAIEALRQMARVVRPGGAVVITTECAINGIGTDQVFVRQALERIIAESGLELADSISWDLDDNALDHVTSLSHGNLAALPHINVESFGSIFTSICLVFRVPASPAAAARPKLPEFDAMLNWLAAEPPSAAGSGFLASRLSRAAWLWRAGWLRLRAGILRSLPGGAKVGQRVE
jgi:SAM-dependent methyltransferase